MDSKKLSMKKVIELIKKEYEESIFIEDLEEDKFDDIFGEGSGVGVRVAVVSGLGNTRKLIEAIRAGEVEYDFVEVMACPGGCAGGGGQPIHDGLELAEDRGKILYGLDSSAKLRFSHENTAVLRTYDEYLEKPNSKRAHELLHTHLKDWDLEIM